MAGMRNGAVGPGRGVAMSSCREAGATVRGLRQPGGVVGSVQNAGPLVDPPRLTRRIGLVGPRDADGPSSGARPRRLAPVVRGRRSSNAPARRAWRGGRRAGGRPCARPSDRPASRWRCGSARASGSSACAPLRLRAGGSAGPPHHHGGRGGRRIRRLAHRSSPLHKPSAVGDRARSCEDRGLCGTAVVCRTSRSAVLSSSGAGHAPVGTTMSAGALLATTARLRRPCRGRSKTWASPRPPRRRAVRAWLLAIRSRRMSPARS